MNDLITVFRMEELTVATRIAIIKQLGGIINHQFASNLTEKIVVELVTALDPSNPIREDEHYKPFL